MSDLTSKPSAREVLELAQVVADCLRVGNAPIRHFELVEVENTLRAYAALLEQPPEASGSQEVALNQGPRLAEGVGSNPDVPGHDRQPNEPGAVLCVPCLHCSRHVPVDWFACGHCGEMKRPVNSQGDRG